MKYANMIVYERPQKDKQLEGMGTTLEVCLIYNSKLYIGHIGDSRIYRIRKEFIKDDIVLMCSDGLTNMVDESQIYEIIKQDYRSAPIRLAEKANENGGYDNITAIVIK